MKNPSTWNIKTQGSMAPGKIINSIVLGTPMRVNWMKWQKKNYYKTFQQIKKTTNLMNKVIDKTNKQLNEIKMSTQYMKRKLVNMRK